MNPCSWKLKLLGNPDAAFVIIMGFMKQLSKTRDPTVVFLPINACQEKIEASYYPKIPAYANCDISMDSDDPNYNIASPSFPHGGYFKDEDFLAGILEAGNLEKYVRKLSMLHFVSATSHNCAYSSVIVDFNGSAISMAINPIGCDYE
ncbi:unnamed protein product [Allacma fusca]|uniref:Uncharacterized protein n=1 Tax=Allacma fusca TaxID=39272 RepID=A0A8J2K3C4_9HEXA|nr:unnamed protein product [Allacma fusca]